MTNEDRTAGQAREHGDKEYRDAFVSSQISIGLPFQIRALREARGWTQAQLAERCGMRQPRIALMESPGATKFNLETLRRIASAFDIALTVKFVPFSELRKWSDDFSPDDFNVSSFIDETPPQPESAKETENGQARSR